MAVIEGVNCCNDCSYYCHCHDIDEDMRYIQVRQISQSYTASQW